MKISVITVTKNSARTIGRTVHSVLQQRDVEVEHIIKDAASSDHTVAIAQSCNPSVIVVSKFDIGIYDAMNQGYASSSGDIIAFLNSDDYYSANDVLVNVTQTFMSSDCDFVYGDIKMAGLGGRVMREWRTGEIDEKGLVGKQIPHPGMFIKREILNRLALPFDPSYTISADLKQQLLLINKLGCKGKYLNHPLVIMENGGRSTSSLSSYFQGWKESLRAYNEVFGNGGLLFVVRKVFSKLSGVRVRKIFAEFHNKLNP